MFRAIKTKLGNMGTISTLCERAEAHALQDRQPQAGAEHFLLAALDLDDGTARLAFQRAGVDPAALRPAIEKQYATALQSIGIAATADEGESLAPRDAEPGVYCAAASGQEVMRILADGRGRHDPLQGAHVVAIVAAMPHGVASRALREMGVDAMGLRTAADEIVASRSVA